ncbi:MAG TPA: hypothetical protein VK638_25895 [Edaphobacter sp.]|jgi:hypothetical protein|nr:hypothetical protein [Edaphobacter sp.]
MKSNITLKGAFAAAIVVFASLFTSLAHAQDGQEIIVSVPFDFSVNHLYFEAGSYKFDLASDEFGMSVINLKTGKKRYITVRPQDSFRSPGLGFLVFNRTGGNQYLSEVHFSGTVGYSRLDTPQKSKTRDSNTILQGTFRK